VSDDGSDESTHVAHCCIILKCCVSLLTPFVFQKKILFSTIFTNIYFRINSYLFRSSSGLLYMLYIQHVRIVLGDYLPRI